MINSTQLLLSNVGDDIVNNVNKHNAIIKSVILISLLANRIPYVYYSSSSIIVYFCLSVSFDDPCTTPSMSYTCADMSYIGLKYTTFVNLDA